MAKLFFNAHAHSFQSGLRTLQSSYKVSSDALRNALIVARHSAQAYEDAVREDPSAWIGEEEGGEILWCQSQFNEMEIEQTEAALMSLRKAYAIAIYHFWERSAIRWTEAHKSHHNKLAELCIKCGHPIHIKLCNIQYLANSLKHNSQEYGKKLRTAWPDVIPGRPQKFGSATEWYDSIHLTDAHIQEIFEVLYASGPQVHVEPLSSVANASET